VQRLQEKCAEAQRKVDIGEAAEAALRTQLKSAEATIQRLKDEAARTKTLVQQTRAACANEVRKRDRQIDGLKKAVTEAGRARGASKSPGVTSITVVGEIDVDRSAGANSNSNASSSDGYDLRTETNSFLAELAKGLSEENELLLSLMRRTTEQLKEMSGWDKEHDGCTAHNHGGANTNSHEHANVIMALPTNLVELSSEIDAVLEHLRIILTNPSFVPIEEVVVREDEIHRLRDGWEKMETRWKEAVHLIDGWRNRMQVSGRSVNVEELKMGLRLSPVRVSHVAETAQGLGLRLFAVPEEGEDEDRRERREAEENDDVFDRRPSSPENELHLMPPPPTGDRDHDPEGSECGSSIFEDDVNVDELDVDEPNVEILQQSVMMPVIDSPPMPVAPQLTPLRDSYAAGNRRSAEVEPLNFRKAPRDISNIVEENTFDLRPPEEPPVPPPHASERLHQSPTKRVVPPLKPILSEEHRSGSPTEISPSVTSVDSAVHVKTSSEEQPRPKSRPTSTRGVAPVASSRPRERMPAATAGTTAASRRRQEQQQKEREEAAAKLKQAARSNVTTRAKTRPKPTRQQSEQDARAPAPVKNQTRAVSAAVSRTTQANDSAASTPIEPEGTTSFSAPPSAQQPRAEQKERPSKPSVTRTPKKGTSGSSSSSAVRGGKPTLTLSTDTDSMPPPLSPTRRDRNREREGEPTSASSGTDPTSGISRTPTKSSSSSNRSPTRVNSRLPLPRPAGGILPPPQQSPLTMERIAAKLAASEREADAARVRAKLKAARLQKSGGSKGTPANGAADNEGGSINGSTSGRSTTTTATRTAETTVVEPSDPGDIPAAPESARKNRNSYLRRKERDAASTVTSRDPSRHRGGTSSAVSRDVSRHREAGDNNSNDRGRGQAQPQDDEQREQLMRQKYQDYYQQQEEEEEVDELAGPQMLQVPSQQVQSQKVRTTTGKREKRRTSRTASRRRSTLNPWELESLIQGKVSVSGGEGIGSVPE